MSKLSRNQRRKKKLAERERGRRQWQSANEDALAKALSERIFGAIEAFGAEMGCEPPRLIERIPGSGCEVANCHANVMKMVHFQGGRYVCGWHFAVVTSDPSDFHLSVVFHAIWQTAEGVLIDITPQSERVLAGQETGEFTPLPFFCEDKRYFKEWEVEDLGNGQLGFRTVRQAFPEQQALSTSLGVSMRY